MIKQMLTKYNYQTGRNRSIQYIVIHYVGATGGSKANAVYLGPKTSGPAPIILWATPARISIR